MVRSPMPAGDYPEHPPTISSAAPAVIHPGDERRAAGKIIAPEPIESSPQTKPIAPPNVEHTRGSMRRAAAMTDRWPRRSSRS